MSRHKPDYAEIARLERELGIGQPPEPEPKPITPGTSGVAALHNLIVEPDGVLRLKTPEDMRVTHLALSSYFPGYSYAEIQRAPYARRPSILGPTGKPIT